MSPKEIEAVILSVEEVIDCTISGFDDDLFGEAIQATIVLQDNTKQEQMKERILYTCSEKLAMFKIPQKIVFESSIVMSSTGKKILNH